MEEDREKNGVQYIWRKIKGRVKNGLRCEEWDRGEGGRWEKGVFQRK